MGSINNLAQLKTSAQFFSSKITPPYPRGVQPTEPCWIQCALCTHGVLNGVLNGVNLYVLQVLFWGGVSFGMSSESEVFSGVSSKLSSNVFSWISSEFSCRVISWAFSGVFSGVFSKVFSEVSSGMSSGLSSGLFCKMVSNVP